MQVKAYKTPVVSPRSHKINDLLDEALPPLKGGCIVVVTSKVVSLCEGRVIPLDWAKKDDIVAHEAQYYLPGRMNPFNVTLSITRNHLVASAGVDESNGGGHFVLWPEDTQASANMIRSHLVRKHNNKNIGVIISDSTTRPFQWGTTGVGLAWSGFAPLHSYIGKSDLFGRPFEFHTNSIYNGLTAAAVVVMGEGAEQTPLAVIDDVPFVKFTGRNPTKKELAMLSIGIEDDIYKPLLKGVKWVKGRGKAS